jgi:hypothetical protein
MVFSPEFTKELEEAHGLANIRHTSSQRTKNDTDTDKVTNAIGLKG